MPNWCENDIQIKGSKEDISALKELVGENLDFNKIIPMPEVLEAPSCGQTGCNVMVVCDKNTMLCHSARGKHGKKNLMEVVEAKCGGKSKTIIPLTKAVINGFSPCEDCINATTKHNEVGVGLDFPLSESIRRYKLYGTDNWYDWKIQNWGTKWGACNVELDWKETFVVGFFSTAWSPPEPIYNALVEKFPNLEIKWHYNEPGNCFSGDFDTGIHNEFSDPCECGCSDCAECCPENFDEEGNYIENSQET